MCLRLPLIKLIPRMNSVQLYTLLPITHSVFLISNDMNVCDCEITAKMVLCCALVRSRV